jgi:hypothetical protein
MWYIENELSTGKGNAQYLDLADDVACGAPFQLYGAGYRGGAGCDHLWNSKLDLDRLPAIDV